MAPIERKNNVRVLFSDDEKRMLRYLADKRGLKVADTLRTVVRDLFREEIAPRKPDEALDILREQDDALADDDGD